jgi:ubiquinone biosynthesis accessory factor UbiJ
MLQTLITRFLQHIIDQNQWAKPHLLPFAGKTIGFDFVLAKARLKILEDGSFSLGEKNDALEANIHAPPSLLLRMMAGDESAKMQFKITGDTHFATEISKVLQNMRWDFEDDLSKLTGDIAANKTVSFAKKAVATAKQQGKDAAEMLSEFWQEEKPILAKKWQVEQFNADVDNVKSDAARLEKRLQKLSTKLNTKSNAKPNPKVES